MIDATSKILIAAAFCGACCVCNLAVAEQSGKTDAVAEKPKPVEEEIIVHGRTPAELRVQIRHAEEAFYGRFNDIESDDEFDIHCRQEQVTGSHLPRRVCVPNFWRDLLAKSGEEETKERQSGGGLDSSYAASSGQYFAEAEYKRVLLAREMQRLVNNDEQLRRDYLRLQGLQLALNASMRRAPAETSAVVQTAGKEALPYGAALEADVTIGRQPWHHALRNRTFTFAHLYGKIRAVDVKCRGHERRVQYKIGVEWTLPDDWRACAVRVDAPRGTTFSLFEFR